LAVNAVIYTAAVWWETHHVVHHLIPCAAEPAEPVPVAEDLTDAA
jgi:hypothetical protein